MSASLVSDLSGNFRSQALTEAASQLGESENSVMRGFQTAAAAIFGGLATRCNNQSGFMGQIFDLISSPSNDRGMLDNIRGVLGAREGTEPDGGLSSKMLSSLFGGQLSRVVAGISEASGLRLSSAAKMMGLAAPIVMSLLRRRVQDGHLTAPALSNLLQNEASEVRNILPSNMFAMVTDTDDRASTVASAYPPALETRKSSTNWLLPLALLALAVLGLVWFFNRGARDTASVAQQATEQVSSAATAVSDTARAAATSIGNFFQLQLPGGLSLNVPRGGLESRLVAFIQDRGSSVDLTTWFEFNRLNFETASATLQAGSDEELNNIAAILTAYPKVRVKIGGYTDNTGNSQANLALSQQRAEAVRQQLLVRGIDASRMEAEGYGQQHPIGDNGTEAGRALNRRIALRVTQK